MSYNYATEKAYVFTDEGQRQLLKMRDWAMHALNTTGAFQAVNALAQVSTVDNWKALALLDRLVELGDIVLIPDQGGYSQYQVYRGKRDGY